MDFKVSKKGKNAYLDVDYCWDEDIKTFTSINEELTIDFGHNNGLTINLKKYCGVICGDDANIIGAENCFVDCGSNSSINLGSFSFIDCLTNNDIFISSDTIINCGECNCIELHSNNIVTGSYENIIKINGLQNVFIRHDIFEIIELEAKTQIKINDEEELGFNFHSPKVEINNTDVIIFNDKKYKLTPLKCKIIKNILKLI